MNTLERKGKIEQVKSKICVYCESRLQFFDVVLSIFLFFLFFFVRCSYILIYLFIFLLLNIIIGHDLLLSVYTVYIYIFSTILYSIQYKINARIVQCFKSVTVLVVVIFVFFFCMVEWQLNKLIFILWSLVFIPFLMCWSKKLYFFLFCFFVPRWKIIVLSFFICVGVFIYFSRWF